jgi:hypothetical protein
MKGSLARRAVTIASLILCSAAVSKAQVKDCAELKHEIEAKLKAKGVTAYTLEIVPRDQPAKGKVVGTCGGGTSKIVYSRGEAPKVALQNHPAREVPTQPLRPGASPRKHFGRRLGDYRGSRPHGRPQAHHDR